MANGNVRGSGGATESAPEHKSPAEIVIPKRWLRAKEAAAYLGLSVRICRGCVSFASVRAIGSMALSSCTTLPTSMLMSESLPVVETGGGA